ncbi:hypothetical protein KAI87_11445, partial [Myxococcota bacterium]|nr:hypothetical protein [Myxococcota bacterium]
SQGSFFMELNSPEFFGKSSYVIGKDTSGGGNQLKRFDLRFTYDQFPHADYMEAGVIRYAQTGDPHWIAVAKVERAGYNQYRFLSGDVGYSLSSGELAWAKGGVDVMLQSGDDFNLTRRGHFGTGFGFHLLFTQVTPEALEFWQAGPVIGGPDKITGMELGLNAQIPFKWFMTALSIAGAAAVEADPNATKAQKARAMKVATDMIESTAREPRDEVFVRLGMIMSINSPDSYVLYPSTLGEEDRNRFYLTLSLIY